ncbi:NAD(P)-dependent oxidoreductase [Actinocorallia populi]|uniref:NAD(P)-dependent oxidoreductase n=1 Tax=Actinocorallia populi TaxID=2079200 RepID=UPI000D0956CC|nr:SDR family oxidoreductase [Actinocorallia populi]
MKLTVFGATGGTGRLLVRQALEAGHHVTAVVRDPARLPIDHPALDAVVADVLDAASLRPALDGRDAALSALGPHGRKDTAGVCSSAISAILEAMETAGVRRVVALSAQPVLRTGAGEPLWSRMTVRPLVRAVYRNVYADLDLMERRLTRSGSDWTVLRPPYLTDAPATGGYRSAVDANVPGSMTRADLARALLDVLDEPATIRHAIGVASLRR